MTISTERKNSHGNTEAKVTLSIKNTLEVSVLSISDYTRVTVRKSAKLWTTKTNMLKKEIKEDPEINGNSHHGFGKSAKTVPVFQETMLQN